MNCSICQNLILILSECKLCQEKFCSEECCFSHNQIYHQSNLDQSNIDNSVNNSSFLNYVKEKSQLQSPFLVLGIMNYDNIIYDPMYSLENFNLIYSNGIPKSIGNGSFGQVFLAINNIDKKTYAIKHMEKEKLIKYLNCLDPIYAEIDIQSRVNHPNIIKLLYVKETEATFDLVMDYAKYGTLFDYVVKNRGLPERIAFKYFIQIVNAIKFLHDNDIIHRDIKPENILLFDNDVVKLSDFGWSIKCIDHLPGGSFTGTTEYMAPELINNLEYGKEIDNWMLGILLYELMHGFSPFRPKKAKFEDSEVVYNIQNHNLNFYLPITDECKELIFSLLETDVNKRCKVDEIFNSKFVKNFEKEETNTSFSHLEKDENENSEKNNRISNSDKDSNTNPKINENNLLKISKSELINRYSESEEVSERLPKEKNITQNYEIFNKNKCENNNLSNSKLNTNTESNILNNKKENKEDDPFEDEDDPNAPKNNNRNRIKNKHNINKSIETLNLKFNNEMTLNPAKDKEKENQKKTISNSPKNNNKKRKNYIKDLNFALNPNTILNNNLLTSRHFRKNSKEKEDLEISEEFKKIKRNTYNSQNKHQKRQEITNYIFNNNKEVDSKSKLLTKKLTLNTSHQMLSLSLSPGTVEYASLLTRSISPDKITDLSKDKINYGNQKYNFPDNLSNESQNLREYPFDHLTSNSSLDIRKPLFNNKNNKSEIREYEKKDIDFVKEKEPNDNMRRKKKREEMPRDNFMKYNTNKNINPKDNDKKGRFTANNLKNEENNKKNENEYEMKTTNSAINEPINLNNLNPITKSIIKTIKENNNPASKSTSIRNYSISTTDDLRTKRQNSDDILITNNQNLNKINELNNNQEIIFSNNLKGGVSSPNSNNLKFSQLKKIYNKNMSFVAKRKAQIIFENNNDNNENKERKQNFLDNKIEKKGLSANKQLRNFSKINKNKKGKKEIKPIKYIKKNKEGNNKNINNRQTIGDKNINNKKIENKFNEKKEIKIPENNIIKIIKNADKESIDIDIKNNDNKENNLIEINNSKNIDNENEIKKEKEVKGGNKISNKDEKIENKEEDILNKKDKNDKNELIDFRKEKNDINTENTINLDKEDNKKINRNTEKKNNLYQNKSEIYSELRENIEKNNENINITKNENKKIGISNNHAYKEIKVIKENKKKKEKDNKENITAKKFSDNKLSSNLIKRLEEKNKESLTKKIIPNNEIANKMQEKNIVNKNEIKQINNKGKFENKKNREKLLIKTIENENSEKKPKEQLKKIFKKTERKYSKEKRYKKIKLAQPQKVEDKNLKLNQNNDVNQKNKYPRKLNTKPNQNAGQFTDSYLQEGSISQNKNETQIKYSYNIKTNNSNSESKVNYYSKKNISNIKEKIKSLSLINNEDIHIIFNKSKSPDERKKMIYKKKGDNSNNRKSKRIEKGIDNTVSENKSIININNNKHENKENIELNKRIYNKKYIDKNIDKKEIINLSLQKNDKDIKKPKKKYRKKLSDDNSKEQNDHSEKVNNDSESFIIDGDSEYGESEIFYDL